MDNFKVKERVRIAISRLKRYEDISERNKELIFKFKDECISEGLTITRDLFYFNRLPEVAKLLEKDFDDATEEDLKRVVRVAIKKFYKWLEGDGENYPEKVRCIKTTFKRSSNKIP